MNIQLNEGLMNHVKAATGDISGENAHKINCEKLWDILSWNIL